MKKLLSFVGALTITASSVTVVAFEYANLVKSSIEAKIRNYINISSLLARGTILSQKSVGDQGQSTDGQDFSLEYVSKYLYGKEITDFFNDSSFQGISDQTVRSLLGSMFNLSSAHDAVYTVKSNSDFQSDLALHDDITVGKKGEEPIMNTMSLLTAATSILFGNDFSATSSANFLETLLSAGESSILGMFTGGTIKSIQDFLFDKNHNQSLFNKISTALSEEDLINQFPDRQITSLTFQEVFNFRQIEF
jgi:MOLPALP family lipoprotein